MTQDDVIEMAREAGFEIDCCSLDWHKRITAFANLVAAKERESAVRAERQRIVNLLMIQHEAAKGAHNYWHVAANLIQAESGDNV